MARTIMVPLDGSTFAERAVAAAAGLAVAAGARIHLVQSHERPVYPAAPDVLVPYDPSWDAALRQQEQDYLHSVASRISERWGLTTRAELIDGVPAVALATYAREMEVDLIVMTTHGRSGLSRVWLGSVADGVVRRSGVPVLLLRPDGETETGQPGELHPQHILIPLDGSELSRGVLDPAVWLGSLDHARYTLLRVALPVPLLRVPVPSTGELMQNVLLEQQAHAGAQLEEVAAQLRARGLAVDVAVVSAPVPAAAILEFAATHAVDLIAIATHGRGGWRRLALGSVADKVVRGALMPVLLFRPPATGVAPETVTAQLAEHPA